MTGDPRRDRDRVLIAEDDPSVALVSSRYLENEGFPTEVVSDGLSAIRSVVAAPPRLLVLDLALPEASGVAVLRQVRAITDTPVVVMTGRRSVQDKVALLNLGADDYLTKPFAPRELVARVQAVLRRSDRAPCIKADAIQPLLVAGLQLALTERVATRDGTSIPLTALEHALLLHLMRSPDQTFTRDQLLRDVWGFEAGDASAVTVLVKRLRTKLELDAHHPRWITTVWGSGYRFDS